MSCIHRLVGAGGNLRPTPAATNMSSATASVQALKSIIERAKKNKHWLEPVISTSPYEIKRRKLQPEREDVWDP
eukprot:14103813-Ditylum_brightwellii.AAC.1